jgi:hypothetical protein
MNVRRIAALLRELADAIEQPEEAKRPRRRPLVPVKATPVSAELEQRVLRGMRRIGAAR